MTENNDKAGSTVHLTYRYRLKDKHSAALNKMARSVNFVWNFCNDTQKHALKWNKKWPHYYDLQKLTASSSKELGISAHTIQKVCERYYRSRKQSKRPYLRYRGGKNLGWVPIKAEAIKFQGSGFKFSRKLYYVWLSRPIPNGAKICNGSNFSQDAKGHWYLNLVLDVPESLVERKGSIGIDLGLKNLASLSDGKKIGMERSYHRTEQKLAKAQRAQKKKQIKNIHAKIANQRRDFLHKVSTNIVKDHGLIVVGNVNSSRLKKTRMAKSVSDAGWSSFRSMLAYKSDYAGARYVEVDEAFTTQTCSDCGSISGPKGREGLGVREWSCDCGASHDRDVNSAKNILRLGLQALTGAAILAEKAKGRDAVNI